MTGADFAWSFSIGLQRNLLVISPTNFKFKALDALSLRLLLTLRFTEDDDIDTPVDRTAVGRIVRRDGPVFAITRHRQPCRLKREMGGEVRKNKCRARCG